MLLSKKMKLEQAEMPKDQNQILASFALAPYNTATWQQDWTW